VRHSEMACSTSDLGPKPDFVSRPDHVRFASDTDRIADGAGGQFGPIPENEIGRQHKAASIATDQKRWKQFY